jgi:colicin import membrane protein
MTEKLAKFEAERSELVEAKEQAVKDAQAKALELAKLKDDVAGVESPESDAEPADKAKAGGKDEKAAKDDKADKKADDKKADAKAKAKARAKAKKKAESAKKKDAAPPGDREL